MSDDIPTSTTGGLPVWGTIGPRGARHMIGEDGSEWLWANCHKIACPNCICHRMSAIWCWPHLDGSLTVAEVIESLAAVKVPA